LPRTVSVLTLAALLSGCSVTAQPDKVPIVGPAVSSLLDGFNPLNELDLAGLIQIDFRGDSAIDSYGE
jgi:PBP1b-binding outer membrane lipoprotein LpoB